MEILGLEVDFKKICENPCKVCFHLKISRTIILFQNCDVPVINVLDEATPYVVRKYIEHVPLYERLSWQMDFSTVTDKIFSIETDNCLVSFLAFLLLLKISSISFK